MDLVHAAQGHNLAGPGLRLLELLGAEELVDAADAVAGQGGAVHHLAPPHAGNAQLAHVLRVDGLDDLDQGLLALGNAQPRRGGLHPGGLVAQGLEQAADAGVLVRGAEEHRHEQVSLHVLGHVLADFLEGRRHVAEQLFHEVVVEVRQLLQQDLPRLEFLGHHGFRHLHQVRILAGFVLVGVLADEVHVARDLLAIANGDFDEDEGPFADLLEGVHDVLQLAAAAGGFHLVDEDHVRHLVVVEELQGGRHHQGPVRIGVAHHHRDVRGHERVGALLAELHGAGAVDEGPGFALVGAGGQTGLHAHLPGLGLQGGVTDRVALLDGALARQSTRHEQEAFHQGGLSREVGTHDGRYPWR